jgi:hypothetical protein
MTHHSNMLILTSETELMGNYKPVPGGVTSASVAGVLSQRSDHSLLELRPGDLIAFRHREGSYYCYNHLSRFLVNGTVVDTTNTGIDVRYSRMFTDNWYDKTYKPVQGVGEVEEDLTKWLPQRTKMLVSGETITPGADMFQTIDMSSADHKRSNWYWRIQIPTAL